MSGMSDMAEESAALRPGCLLWRYAGDWRSMLPGSAAGILQLMHPGIGAGVAEHSAFFDDPFDRIYRSVPQIWATLFSSDGERRGRALRDVHRTIKGTDHRGRRYHALDPETFWWAHATFTWEIFRSIELFHRRALAEAQREQLYAETVTWYRRYGVSTRPVPADYAGFRDKFSATCRETLEMTPAAERALSYRLADIPGEPWGPIPLQGLLRPIAGPAAEILVRGCLPGEVRRRFAMPWGAPDQAQFRAICAAVRQGFRFVPDFVNRRTLRDVQRRIGAATRARRYHPAA